jgi:hypothetical protein
MEVSRNITKYRRKVSRNSDRDLRPGSPESCVMRYESASSLMLTLISQRNFEVFQYANCLVSFKGIRI